MFVNLRSRMVVALSLALLLASCQQKDGHFGGMPPSEVTVVKAQPKDVPITFEYVGQIAGSREVEVRARVTGILLKRNYHEGRSVQEGQSMFTIDPAPFETALHRAEAQLASNEAKLGQAERNSARLKPLHAVKAVSQKEYDEAIAAEEVARADVKLARANVQEANLNLGYTKVAAPISGVASRALRSEGTLVSGPDVLLTTVAQINPIYVLFGISDDERLKLDREVEAGRLVIPKGQMEVTLKLSDGSSYQKSGRLNFSDVRINNATGTSEARAELPNPSRLLRPGQFVRVIIKGAHRPNAIVVPQRSVLEGPQGKFIYVVSAENKAEARPVEVGDWLNDSWVIKSGINPGDRVIVDGVMRIGPGAPVKVAEPAPPNQPAAPAAPKS